MSLRNLERGVDRSRARGKSQRPRSNLHPDEVGAKDACMAWQIRTVRDGEITHRHNSQVPLPTQVECLLHLEERRSPSQIRAARHPGEVEGIDERGMQRNCSVPVDRVLSSKRSPRQLREK